MLQMKRMTALTETRATCIVLFGITITILTNDNAQFLNIKALPFWLGLLETLLLTLLSCSGQKYFRRNAELGVLCCPLLPVSKLLSSACDRTDYTTMLNQGSALQTVFLEGSFIVSLITMCHESTRLIFERQQILIRELVLLILSFITITTACLVLTLKAWLTLDLLLIGVCLGLLVMQHFLHHCLPRWLPRSFTCGEAAIVSQGCAIYVMAVGNQYINAWQQLKLGQHLSMSLEALLFTQTAVLSCAIVLILLYLVSWFRSNVGYYILVPSVAGMFSLPILFTFLRQDFVSWCFKFITSDTIRVSLFCYWTIGCLIAVVVVYFNASNAASVSKESHIVNHHVSSTVRKQFHLLAVAILLPGILLDVEILYVAVSCTLVVLLMLESVRILRIVPVGDTLNQYFQVFVDSRDEGLVILTHIYLMVGCSTPLWLHCGSIRHVALYSGLLSLGIGDTMASIAGSKVGCHVWKGTMKTVEGTCCAILVQFAVAALLGITGAAAIPCLKSVTAIILTSMFEAFTTQIDNLILPLFMYMMFV